MLFGDGVFFEYIVGIASAIEFFMFSSVAEFFSEVRFLIHFLMRSSRRTLWTSDASFSRMTYMKYDVGVRRWLILLVTIIEATLDNELSLLLKLMVSCSEHGSCFKKYFTYFIIP